MKALPEFCIHRYVPELPHITHELATQGMKVIYKTGTAQAEVGVIQEVRSSDAFVLYLGDRTAKLTQLSDLTYWDGPREWNL